MYKVNGIDLSTLEFEELKRLIACDDSEVKDFAMSRLLDKETNVFNSDVVDIYKELHRVGLISGQPVMGGFLFDSLTLAGLTFVDEYKKAQSEQKRKTKSERAFQVKLSVLTFVLSIITSIITSFLVSRLLP